MQFRKKQNKNRNVPQYLYFPISSFVAYLKISLWFLEVLFYEFFFFFFFFLQKPEKRYRWLNQQISYGTLLIGSNSTHLFRFLCFFLFFLTFHLDFWKRLLLTKPFFHFIYFYIFNSALISKVYCYFCIVCLAFLMVTVIFTMFLLNLLVWFALQSHSINILSSLLCCISSVSKERW